MIRLSLRLHDFLHANKYDKGHRFLNFCFSQLILSLPICYKLSFLHTLLSLSLFFCHLIINPSKHYPPTKHQWSGFGIPLRLRVEFICRKRKKIKNIYIYMYMSSRNKQSRRQRWWYSWLQVFHFYFLSSLLKWS